MTSGRTAIALTVLLLASCYRIGPPGERVAGDAGYDVSDAGASDADSRDGGADAMEPDTSATDSGVDADATEPETCGDGVLQADEKCDPALPDGSPGTCPVACDDGIACTEDLLDGAAEECDAVCRSTPITTCSSGDGCCPGGCTAGEDDDCDGEAVCGDGRITAPELCDPGIASGDNGACPTVEDCPTLDCKRSRVIGSPQNCDATCSLVDITACEDGDGCCPAGCDSASDDDCNSVCGNGVVEPGETCDGACPVSCDDGDACTDEALTGSAGTCDVACEIDPVTACVAGDGCCPSGCDSGNDADCSATCGNGVVDAGETCDPPGSCPASCNDGDACTADTLSGSSSNCNVACSNTPITTCNPMADGCCPAGCNANTDPDCSASCGNGVVEGTETCDGNCPASCDDADACTADSRAGDTGTCDVVCTNSTITSCIDADGCCATGCTSLNDDDCGAVCGNGVVEGTETCDGNCPASCDDSDACTVDLMMGSADQCNVTCSNTAQTSCLDGDGCCPSGCNANNDDDCSATCGNGITEAGETCDGDCPTADDCAAMGACIVLAGSAMNCTAVCTTDAGCVACDPVGSCPCAGAEECIAGVCQASDGDGCTNACDEAAFCEVHGGSGWVCDASDDLCYDCLQATDCEPYETCVSRSCTTPDSCSDANDPDAWCVNAGTGDTCSGGDCHTSCMDDPDCGTIETCDMNVCVTASSCDQANDPDDWCAAFDLGSACVGSTCQTDCSDSCDCAADQYCPTQSMVRPTCEPTPSCGLVCDPAGYCADKTGSMAAKCVVGADPEDAQCTNYDSCLTAGDCNFGFEYCDNATCVPAPNCSAASSPDGYCAFFFPGTTCSTVADTCE